MRKHAQWESYPSYESCFDALGGDIVCIQEAKLTRRHLERSMCVMKLFEAYYDLNPDRGYAGVATFVRKDACMPSDAYRGITGALEEAGLPYSDLPLDAEGRAVVLDCGLFVLINVYAPNETDETRTEFRNDKSFARISADPVVGDLNTLYDPDDHCEGRALVGGSREAFDNHPARAWLKELVQPDGLMIDTTRSAHPGRRDMYTCWNTLIDARSSNYGTRIDYILVSRGLKQWVGGGNIWPHIHGSDHCPVVLELKDTIVVDGNERRLVDELHGLGGAAPHHTLPKLAASRMPEFNDKVQPKLVTMFREQKAASPTAALKASEPQRKKRRASSPPQQSLASFFGKKTQPVPEEEPNELFFSELSSKTIPAGKTEAAAQWGAIFSSPPPPKCTFHREPARIWTVNKPGPNQGRKFWLCARPVGPGYKERARTPESRGFRCDFFLWDSEWRRRQSGHFATT
ncbi:DNA-(apurinic or apyrimidinic site) lyase [Malassezia cuniculi]|uniref:DNA-(apurinic or apyrimidinic site) endonuclease n=1 Tax=Malassezia cuniculi TaxID=948313 RepID=A0AAF0EP61_9BASI|nr:DNA-(apurinic or apyrimidinic site) lyase [Malassezia cuniculi]